MLEHSKALINNQIEAAEVRVIGENGEQLGILSLAEALSVAEAVDKDLVLISSQAVPPVCRIIDYGKYRFEQDKKQKAAKKSQKAMETKEIQLTCSIDEHDLKTKMKHANEFLSDGYKVRFILTFHGREITFSERGMKIITTCIDSCSDAGTVQKEIVHEGNNITATLCPKQRRI
jgi:translation initiation factor IF-3